LRARFTLYLRLGPKLPRRKTAALYDEPSARTWRARRAEL